MNYKINNIYNEDSYKAIKEIPDKSIDCIYTDVPYLYNSTGKDITGKSAVSKRISKIQNKDLLDIRSGFDYKLLDDFIRIMKKINIFIWCSKEQIYPILDYFNTLDCYFEILTWNKTNPTPSTNNKWLPDIEYCLYFRESGVPLNDGYELKSKWYKSPINKSDKDLYDHPTIKPLELVKRHLLHATQPNDIVVDFFLGSGTTCIAAKQIGRNYIGFELNKDYFNIAQDRLNGTNQISRKLMNKGQTSILNT